VRVLMLARGEGDGWADRLIYCWHDFQVHEIHRYFSPTADLPYKFNTTS